MPDSFRSTFPIEVEFTAGEQPTASKFTSWAAQTSAGLKKVEEALGDLWSDSYPLFDSTNTPAGAWAWNRQGLNIGVSQRHAQIANIARLIGPASVLNPRMLSGRTASIINEPLSADQDNEFYLQFIPVDGTVTFSNTTIFATEVADEDLIDAIGEYFIDYDTGRVKVWNSANPASSIGTVTYDVDVSDAFMGDTYEDASFNVIPDPNQATKCTVSGPVSGQYTITIPVILAQQANYDDTDKELSAVDDLNKSAQITLPPYFEDEFNTGDIIPGGLVKLWDNSAAAFVEGITFYYVSQTSIKVSDEEELVTGSTRYSLVTVGTDITRTLDALRTKYRRHRHDGTDGAQRIRHKDLSGNATGYVVVASTRIPFTGPSDNTSQRNDHPQYLHRGGPDNTPLRNAAFGLLLASTGLDGSGLPFSSSSDSYAIRFLSGSSGAPGILVSAADNALLIENKNVRIGESLVVTDIFTAESAANFDGVVDMDSTLDVAGQISTATTIVAKDGIRGTVVNDGIMFYEDTGTIDTTAGLTSISLTLLSAAGYTIMGFNVLLRKPSNVTWYPPGLRNNGDTIYYTAALEDSAGSGLDTIVLDDFGTAIQDTAEQYRLVVFYKNT